MKGWTVLPNFVWDRADLTVYERAVLVHIVRKTIGWGKRTDGISYSQFVLALAISKSSASKAIDGLIAKQIIVKKHQKNKRGGHSFNLYYLRNKIIKQANESGDKPIPPHDQGLYRETDKAIPPRDQGLYRETDTQDTLEQETLDKRESDPSAAPNPNIKISISKNFTPSQNSLDKIRLAGIKLTIEDVATQVAKFTNWFEPDDDNCIKKTKLGWQKRFVSWVIDEWRKYGGGDKSTGKSYALADEMAKGARMINADA